uniref:O-acyltransferase n=1 Tax=Cuphea avigera var. pulcherrima TaxID=83566 RepID=A0A193DVK9_9MYRT|nr:diacylglycerol O-acyltransferase 1 [Cuphea avigera var. pulcherrima]
MHEAVSHFLHRHAPLSLSGFAMAIVSGTLGVAASSFIPDSDHSTTSPSLRKRNSSSLFPKASDTSSVDGKAAHRTSSPVHLKLAESPLSSRNIFKQNHEGLFNLCMVTLVAVIIRLFLENLLKYGWLMKRDFWLSTFTAWPLFICSLGLPIFPLAAFVVEKLAQKNLLPEPIVLCSHVIITSASVLYPALVILRFDCALMSGIGLMLYSCALWLKLVSYAHTSYDMRCEAKSRLEGKSSADSKNGELPYRVNIKDLAYFMVAPTLCYQLSYPRTQFIRKFWVARQVLKLILVNVVMGFIIEQYMIPVMHNSKPPRRGYWLHFIERNLKLAVPSIGLWFCIFYSIFHLWLNIVAELLRFGDREFYKDWWNAKNMEEYWKMWNIPVHRWMVRHLYGPCMKRKLPRWVAISISFLLSAVLHEICVSVPCHVFQLWAFNGMMLQIPLVLSSKPLQKRFPSSKAGNVFFWFLFCIYGQPNCVLMYYHALMERRGLRID